MAADRQWWNGKALGAVEWVGGIVALVGVVVFIVSDGFRSAVGDGWDWCWPWGQLLAELAVFVLLVWLLLTQMRQVRRLESALGACEAAKGETEERSDRATARVAALEAALSAATADTVDADRALYTDLMRSLPVGGRSVEFARRHSFENSFASDDIDAWRRFVQSWGGPDKTFHDAAVESARAELLESARQFDVHLAVTSFYMGDERYRIYPDVPLDYDNGENSYALEAVSTAEMLGAELVAKYETFVTTARRQLRV